MTELTRTMQKENTPVLLIIFNRPDKVQRLIAALEKVKPTKIFVSADGPRKDSPKDGIRCAEARKALKAISWDCEFTTNFFDSNLGCDRHVERAMSWFFEHVEQGVILEDDCIPHPDFFSYARELLVRYEGDPRVMMISGNNFQDGRKHGDASYYFSRYPNTWGWATWKRAWKRYDTNLTELPQFVTSQKIINIRPRRTEQRYWLRYFGSLYRGTRTAWDAKWLFSIWNTDGIVVTPNVNLVQNIGFGKDATHTFSSDYRWSIGVEDLGEALRHPTIIKPNESADQFLFDKLYAVTLRKRLSYIYNKFCWILSKKIGRLILKK